MKFLLRSEIGRGALGELWVAFSQRPPVQVQHLKKDSTPGHGGYAVCGVYEGEPRMSNDPHRVEILEWFLAGLGSEAARELGGGDPYVICIACAKHVEQMIRSTPAPPPDWRPDESLPEDAYAF